MKKIFTIAACLIIAAIAYGQDVPKTAERPTSTNVVPAESLPSTTDTTKGSGSASYQPVDGVYKIGGNVTKPQVTHQVDPKYSHSAKRERAEGDATIGLIVDAQGNPQNVHVVKSFRPDLDANAVAAVKKYKFMPATKDGVPVPVQLSIMISFRVY